MRTAGVRCRYRALLSTAALAHQSLGDGPPLVVLHGLFGSSTNWRSVGRHLAASHTVHLLDMRNHGGSAHAPGMRYPELAADVCAWANEHVGERLTLIGHSMGGKTAMWIALDGLLDLERLCIVDIAPVAYEHPEHGHIIDALYALPLKALRSRADGDRLLAARIPDRQLRQFLLQNLVANSTGGSTDGTPSYRWRIDLGALRDGLDDLLDFPLDDANATVFQDCPVACLRGAQSHYVAPPRDQAFAHHFPGARIESVIGAGHWPHAEQPRAFTAALDLFLGLGDPAS